MLDSIFATYGVSVGRLGISLGTALVLGVVVAGVYMYRNTYTKNFVVTLALLPAIVGSVILVVNGNLGTGIAVMGAFSLVRFRSVPGSAREIGCIFYAMAAGLATGMGYIFYAVAFTLVIGAAYLFFTTLRFGEQKPNVRSLRVTIPEDLDYAHVFDDVFAEYADKATLDRVRTANLGSLYELQYTVTLKKPELEKDMLDKIRQRNGNLNISCGSLATVKDEL